MSALRFLADENLNERLVLALLRRLPGLDIVRVRDTERVGRTDDDLLEWAAQRGRVVITHDARTMPAAAYARVADGRPMPGVFIVPDDAPARSTIEDLTLIAEAGAADDFVDRVMFVPLADL